MEKSPAETASNAGSGTPIETLLSKKKEEGWKGPDDNVGEVGGISRSPQNLTEYPKDEGMRIWGPCQEEKTPSHVRT